MPGVTLKIALLLTLAALLAGCGTVEGMGRDISDASVTVRGWIR
jgi:predicted small secreted protein